MPRLAAFLLLSLVAASCRSPQGEEASVPLAPDSAALAHETPGGRSAVHGLPPVPSLALPTVEGDSLRLTDFLGNVVVVNYWATWCAPCREEIPDLNQLHQDLADQGVKVVGISLDEGTVDLRPFIEEFDIQYPIAWDDGTLADQLGGIYALPTTFVVDPEGKITHRYIGIFPMEMRDQLVELARRHTSTGM